MNKILFGGKRRSETRPESESGTTGVILLTSFKKRPVSLDWQLLRRPRGGTAKPTASRSQDRKDASSIFSLVPRAPVRLVYLLACSHPTCSQLDTPVSNYVRVTRVRADVCVRWFIIIVHFTKLRAAFNSDASSKSRAQDRFCHCTNFSPRLDNLCETLHHNRQYGTPVILRGLIWGDYSRYLEPLDSRPSRSFRTIDE